MSRQKTRQDRDLINNRRIYQDVADGAGGMLACAGTSGRRSAMYGAAEPSRGMMRGAVMDASAGGCAAAAVRTGGGGPSDRRYANAIGSSDPEAVQESFEAQVSRQLGIMRDAGGIPRRGLTVAVDMHLICRYDRRPGGELTSSRYEKRTKYFERYITAQCAGGGRRLVLAAHHVRVAESVPEHVGRVLDSSEGAGVRTRLLLPGREFFSVDTIDILRRRDAGFLMPCKNTGNVVAALREFDRGQRPATSGNMLECSTGSIPYDMLIARRRKKSKCKKSSGGRGGRRGEGRVQVDRVCHKPPRRGGRVVFGKVGHRDRVCQDRGAQGQDEDHLHGCQDAVLLPLDGPAQRVDGCQDAAVRRDRRAERNDDADLQGVSGVDPDKARAPFMTPDPGYISLSCFCRACRPWDSQLDQEQRKAVGRRAAYRSGIHRGPAVPDFAGHTQGIASFSYFAFEILITFHDVFRAI